MTAAPMTAVAVGTTSGWLAVNTASVLRLRDCASGTSTASYNQEWRCQDVGSDASRSIRIARVEACVAFDVSGGPDRKSRALHLMKRGKSRSVARICDEAKFFVAHIRDETNISIDLSSGLAGDA